MGRSSKVRKAVSAVVGAAALGGLAYEAYLFASAEDRVRRACGEISVGMPISALRNFADGRGLSAPRADSGVVFLVETKTFGRWGCRVVLEKGLVQTATYNFAD